MIDNAGLEEIERAIEVFAEGTPMHFETMIAEGVFFDFDCPFTEDLIEPVIPVAVGIHSWSPHNHGEPTDERLMDYADGFGDEVVCDLEEAFYNSGSRNEEVHFCYSKRNSDPESGFILFLGDIHNPRISGVTTDAKEVGRQVAEKI